LALKESSRLALFRIFEQSVQNACQHADASKIDIHFHIDEDTIHLSVEDNGKGFDVPDDIFQSNPVKHFGLINCHERAKMIGGKLYIFSNPGTGTLMLVKAPRSENLQEETLDPYLVD
jgi:signal transduction histidine kinase